MRIEQDVRRAPMMAQAPVKVLFALMVAVVAVVLSALAPRFAHASEVSVDTAAQLQRALNTGSGNTQMTIKVTKDIEVPNFIFVRGNKTLIADPSLPEGATITLKGNNTGFQVDGGAKLTVGKAEGASQLTIKGDTIDDAVATNNRKFPLFLVLGSTDNPNAPATKLTLNKNALLRDAKSFADENANALAAGAMVYGINASIEVNGAVFENLQGEATQAAMDRHFNVAGALYVQAPAKLTVTDGTIRNCKGTNAGAIATLLSPVTLKTGTIEGCTSETFGGAIQAFGASVSVIKPFGAEKGFVFKNNKAKQGGAINAQYFQVPGGNPEFLYGNLVVTDAEFIGNSVEGSSLSVGGAIMVAGSSVRIQRTSFTGNVADQGGAANIQQAVGTPNVSSCTFEQNEARKSGGALSAVEAAATLKGNTFNNNRALQGGAILFGAFTTNPTLTLENNAFTANSAQSQNGNDMHTMGGAISLTRATVAINGGNTFTGNTSAVGGGAVATTGGKIIVEAGNTFTDNEAKEIGGAIMVSTGDPENPTAIPGSLTINGGEFTGNTSRKAGGAIYVEANSTFKMVNGSINNNTAVDGGGVFADGVDNKEATHNKPTVQLGAHAKIYDNTGESSAKSNLYIRFPKVIELIEEPADDFKVGVVCKATIDGVGQHRFTVKGATSMITEDKYKLFSSDVDGYFVTTDIAPYEDALRLAKKITRSFEWIGAKDGSLPQAPESQTKFYNGRAQLPVVEDTATLHFEGWFADKEGTKPFKNDRLFVENLTLYGKWVLINHPVSFGFTNDTPEEHRPALPQDMEVRYDKTLAEQLPTPKDNSYMHFAGWYVDEEGSKALDLETMPTKALKIYLKYAQETGEVTVNYHIQGEDGQYKLASSTQVKAPMGSTYTLQPAVKDGYALNAGKSVLSGVLTPDKKLELDVYYDLKNMGYQVESYFQDKDGNYELDKSKTQSLTGAVGSQVSVKPAAVDGFTFNAKKSQTKGVVSFKTKEHPEGLVLKLYYDREKPKPITPVNPDTGTGGFYEGGTGDVNWAQLNDENRGLGGLPVANAGHAPVQRLIPKTDDVRGTAPVVALVGVVVLGVALALRRTHRA